MERRLPAERSRQWASPAGLPGICLAVACAAAFLAGCGGGSGAGGPAGSTTVRGSVFAAPVSGAQVTVKTAAGVTVAGPVATAPDGTYGIGISDGALSGDLRIEAVGGTFTDEATGTGATAGRLSAYVPGGSLGAAPVVHLTPFSTIVHDLVVGGRSVADARSAFAAAFGFTDNAGVAPRNDNAATGADNVAGRLAALRAVAFSMMAKDLGLPPGNQFQLVAAIAEDLADGVPDGRNAASPVNILPGNALPEDVQNRFERAVDKVFDNTSINRTGLTADQIGTLPFGKVALTDSYRVEYVPGAMPPAQGRTQFRVRVTRLSDNTAVTGLAGSLRLMPWMHMATKSHSSPWDNAVVDNGDGTYSFTVYYLMSTAMNGISMGYWHVDVVIGGSETATFYPTVGMAMGTDTVRAQLKGQQDNIAAGPAPEQRTYTLFKDGGMTYDNTSATHTLNVFVSAKESMTSFPAVSAGTVLHDAGGAPWTVGTMSVDASTDNVVWRTGTNSAGGHWSVPGLTGLPRGAAGHVSVRVIVNGEQKTTNGGAPSGTNASADFTVTAP